MERVKNIRKVTIAVVIKFAFTIPPEIFREEYFVKINFPDNMETTIQITENTIKASA